MKKLESVTGQYCELLVIECDCGFHIGLDETYLDQVDDIFINCPSCHLGIKTKDLNPYSATT